MAAQAYAAEVLGTDAKDDGCANQYLTGLIEVDADVVSGDSGGAILDKHGDVVGMGSAEIAAYTIPIAKVRPLADVIDTGKETSSVTIGYDGFLGVEVDDGTAYHGGSGTVIAGVLRDTAAAELEHGRSGYKDTCAVRVRTPKLGDSGWHGRGRPPERWSGAEPDRWSS